MTLEKLPAFVNEHDCGVKPTGRIEGDEVVISCQVMDLNTKRSWVEESRVKDMHGAKDVLGY